MIKRKLSLNERLQRLERKVGVNRNNRNVREERSTGASLSSLVSIVRKKLKSAPESAFEVFGLNPQNYTDNTQEFIDTFGLGQYGFVSFSYLEELADKLSNEGKDFAYEGYDIYVDPVENEEDGLAQDYDGNWYGRRSHVYGEKYKSDNYTGEYLGFAFYLSKVNGSTTW